MEFGKRCLLPFYAALHWLAPWRNVRIVPTLALVVKNPLALRSTNGTLQAEFTMRHSVDEFGYTHYCYNYETAKGDIESPTLQVNPGDTLKLEVKDRIKTDDSEDMGAMDMSGRPGKVCGDTGTETISSTNVHFHGMLISPHCHQDDVLTTLIQPGSPGFQYDIQVPKDDRPACTGTIRTFTALRNSRLTAERLGHLS